MPLDILPQLIVLALAKNEGREIQRKAGGDLVVDGEASSSGEKGWTRDEGAAATAARFSTERVRCDANCATPGEMAWGVRGDVMRGDATTRGEASRGEDTTRGDARRGDDRPICRGVEIVRASFVGCLERVKLRFVRRGTDFVCVVAMREEVGLCAAFWCAVWSFFIRASCSSWNPTLMKDS